MKVLITGASGLVGKNLVYYLKNMGYEIIGTYHNTVPDNSGDLYVKCDLSKGLTIQNEVDAIIHCAALLEGRAESQEARNMVESNIIATHNVTEFAERKSVKKLIYLSSVSVFGDVQGVLHEDSNYINVGLYGMTKRIAEFMINEANIDMKCSIRLPRMLGPGIDLNNTRESGLLKMIQKLVRDEEVVCYIPEVRYNNFMHVLDLAEFLSLLLKMDHMDEPEINLGARDNLKMLDILNLIRNELNSKSKIEVEDKGIISKCALIDITKAMKYGYDPQSSEDVLRNFIKEI